MDVRCIRYIYLILQRSADTESYIDTSTLNICVVYIA